MMQTTRPHAARTGAGSSTVMQLFRWTAGLTAVVIWVQAVLAGQWLGGDGGIIVTHGWIGNGTFLLTIALAALAFAGWRQGNLGSGTLSFAGLLVLLVTAQIGLGYAGRGSTMAVTMHIPLGVLIFGLMTAVFVLTLTTRTR